jgi:hypothetical protein
MTVIPAIASNMRLALQMFESPTGNPIADFSGAIDISFDSNEHGYRSLTFTAPMSQVEAFYFYDMAPAKWIEFGFGAGVAWEGRVEDREIVDGGLRITAMGAWRALSDVPYTALWSKSGTADWELGIALSNYSNDAYEIDNNNRIYFAPRKGESFSPFNPKGFYSFLIPYNSQRNIDGVSFDYELLGDGNSWVLAWRKSDRDGSGLTYIDAKVNGTGTTTGSVYTSGLNCERFIFEAYVTSGVTHSGDTGTVYAKITNIRVVTSTENAIDTTTTTTISAGSQVVTPASMTGIYVGQRLIIDSGASTSESVVVTAVTASTFTATFANSYSGTTTIQAHAVYADEIIKDLVSHVNGVNSGELSDVTGFIESPGLDLLDESYEDMYPADIATKLARLGDGEDPPRRWEVGVWDDQILHFRPRGSAAQAWYVDIDRVTLNSTLDAMRNSAYGLYQDDNGSVLRTAAADDENSQEQNGIIRRAALQVQTTSATQAEKHRDALLADKAEITPQTSLRPDRLMDAGGSFYAKWLCRTGDTCTIRNLPPTLSDSIDKIRTFVIGEVAYNPLTDELQITPETPLPSLEVLVARREEGL